MGALQDLSRRRVLTEHIECGAIHRQGLVAKAERRGNFVTGLTAKHAVELRSERISARG